MSNFGRMLPPAVARIGAEELGRGSLRQLFRDGAKAVILYGDERVGALWQGLVERPDGIGNFSTESIFDLARNHRYGERHSGDMLRFYPGAYAHIARKLILFRDETGGTLRRLPADFLQEGKRHSAPEYLYEIRSATNSV